MIVIKQHRIYRVDLRANPKFLYVFGDNLDRKGFGGQAKEIRGEPNAFGIVTKRKAAHGHLDCYLHDYEKDAWAAVDKDFDHLCEVAYDYWGIILPLDGIGTGLAQLSEYAPNLLKHINEKLEGLKDL